MGAAFSANKGAASMLQAVIDRLEEEVGPCRISILTTYPAEDRLGLSAEVGVISARPLELLFPLLPLALLARVLRFLRLPPHWAGLTGASRALLEADVVLDLAGISFSDGRGLPILVYNILMDGIPLLMGCRVVKGSQALGPFRERLNRAAARRILGRVHTVCARGPRTAAYLRELGLKNVVEAADLAFLMKVPEACRQKARILTAPLGGQDYIALCPSAVVRGYCRRLGIDYLGILGEVVQGLLRAGRSVVLFSHSSRPGRPESRMNDDPLCRELAERVGAGAPHFLFLEGSYPPTVLRAVVEGASVLVSSRFHAMVSALASGTPPLVVGWSHKYEEVMSQLLNDELVIPYQRLSSQEVLQAVDTILEKGQELRRRLAESLPSVVASARRNFEVVRHALERPDV